MSVATVPHLDPVQAIGFLMVVLCIAMLPGLIAGSMAHKRGRPRVLWFILGTILVGVAHVMLACMRPIPVEERSPRTLFEILVWCSGKRAEVDLAPPAPKRPETARAFASGDRSKPRLPD